MSGTCLVIFRLDLVLNFVFSSAEVMALPDCWYVPLFIIGNIHEAHFVLGMVVNAARKSTTPPMRNDTT